MTKKKDRVSELIRSREWTAARKQIRSELRSSPHNHWLLSRLALTYYEQRRYAKALSVSDVAVGIAPHCPLVLWEHAACLHAIGRRAEAIRTWRHLLKRGVRSIAYGVCGEGLAWAKALLSDCRLRLAMTYLESGEFDSAKRYLGLFRKHYEEGRKGIFGKGDADRLSEVLRQRCSK